MDSKKNNLIIAGGFTVDKFMLCFVQEIDLFHKAAMTCTSFSISSDLVWEDPVGILKNETMKMKILEKKLFFFFCRLVETHLLIF